MQDGRKPSRCRSFVAGERDNLWVDRSSLQAMLERGLSLAEIGRRLGRHESTVGYWVRKHGLEAGGAWPACSARRAHPCPASISGGSRTLDCPDCPRDRSKHVHGTPLDANLRNKDDRAGRSPRFHRKSEAGRPSDPPEDMPYTWPHRVLA